jgi:hypothetical protein
MPDAELFDDVGDSESFALTRDSQQNLVFRVDCLTG